MCKRIFLSHQKTKKDLLDSIMKHEDFVAYGNPTVQMTYDVYKKCEVIALPRKYGFSQQGYIIPKNSSLTPLLTYYITQLIESGTVDRFKSKYKLQEQVCPTYVGKPLGIKKLLFPFGLLCIGGGLSVMWFL